MSVLWLVLIVLLVLALAGGVRYGGPAYGAVGYSGPLVAVLVLVLILALLGLL